MNQMRKMLLVIFIILFSLPFSVSALPLEDDTMQGLCDGSSATSSIIYTLKDGTRRYLFCNNAYDGIGENTIDICNDDGKLSIGDSICLNRGQKTITLKNFDGEQLYIGDIDFDGDGEYEDIKIIYEGTNIFNTQNDDPYNAAILSKSPLTIEGKDSSSSLTINVNKRNSSGIYRDGISVIGGDLNFKNCSNLNVNVNSTCLSSGFVFSGIKIDEANLIIENSNITVNVNDIGETCSSETRTIGVGINAIDSGVVIGQDESETDTTVTINTELDAIYMINGTSSIKDFSIKEQVTSSEISNNEHISQSNRDTKLLINYNSTNKKNNLLNFYNSNLKVEGWMEIIGDLKAVDSDPLFSAIYDMPVYFYGSKLDVREDGTFIISASSPNAILLMENSIIETDGTLHIKNIDSDHSSIKLLGNDSNVIIGKSASSLETLNIKDKVYLDPEIKWTYGNKLISNKNTSRPVYINSKKALHHGWLATNSIADSNVTLSGIASINILDKGIAKLTKDSTLEASNIFALPTKDNTYQVLTRISSSLVSNEDELKLYLAKLDGNNYVQVGETLTTKAGTLKLGTMSDFVYNKDDMEDYSDLINSNDMYYSFELTAEQLSSGIYYILETTETKTYFEDESSAETGIRLYPPKALSSKYKFFSTSNLNVESKIESEINNLGFPSTDFDIIDYYEFSFSADDIAAPDGVYKIKIPTHGDYGSEAQIYAFNSSGSKLDRTFAATMEDDYYVFEINKSDLDSTIFALVDFAQINSLKDSTGKYILTAGHNRIYSGCKFIVNIGSQSVSGNVTQNNRSFELRCGDNYTLPDIVYSIRIPKPNGTSPKLYDGVNISTAKEVSLTPITEDKLSFDLSNTDIDKTPTTYALTYTNACSTVTQTKYKIKFNTDGGNTISEETVTIGSTGKDLPTPTKSGYTFDYWQYSDGTKVTATKTTDVLRDADKIIEKDSNGCPTEYYKTIELKAVWKQNSGCNAEMNFKVIYNVDGGNPISEETVTSSTTKNIPTPTKNDHKFLGWYSDSAKTKKITVTKLKDLASPKKDSNGCITGYNDVNIYASWEKITTYTVTFITDGGTPVPAPQKIEVNGKVEKPTDPTKTGYAFKEWQLNNVTYDFSKAVTSDITLNAVWTENSSCENIKKEFKLTYYGEDKTVKVTEDTTDELPLISHCGYSIKGWCYDEACTKPINSETLLKDLIVTSIKTGVCTTGYENLTIYPNIEKASTETDKRSIFLNYFTNGGNELVEERDVLDINFDELLVPTRNGYTFEGWYKDEELSEKITEEKWKQIQQESYEWISKDPACHLSLIALYAKWIENETEVVSVGGAQITHELIDDASKFEFVVDQLTENETAFISGILENAKKTADPKKIIDIYKFNLNAKDEGTVLPGGKYQIKIPITDLMNKYDQLELVKLDEKGNITDQYYSLTKDGDYYVITINYEDLGKTNFALIGNEIKQVSTGIPFKVGAFTILIAGFGYVSYKIKKKNKLFKI